MDIISFIKDSTTECAPFSWGLTLFSQGCNLCCAMCKGYNYERIINKNNVIGDAKNILKDNISPIHDSVIFLGGEPTIWGSDLVDVLQFSKNIGLKTKIFTNGINYELISRINSLKLCDAWSVDFKGIHSIRELFGIDDNIYISCFSQTIKSIMDSKLPLEIRTTFFDGNIIDREDICNYCTSIISSYNDIQPNIYKKYIEQFDVRGII